LRIYAWYEILVPAFHPGFTSTDTTYCVCVVLISDWDFGPGNTSRFHIHWNHVFCFFVVSTLNFLLAKMNFEILVPAFQPRFFFFRHHLLLHALIFLILFNFFASFISTDTTCFYIHPFTSILYPLTPCAHTCA
jgi:hypothetical protein